MVAVYAEHSQVPRSFLAPIDPLIGHLVTHDPALFADLLRVTRDCANRGAGHLGEEHRADDRDACWRLFAGVGGGADDRSSRPISGPDSGAHGRSEPQRLVVAPNDDEDDIVNWK